ncbi:MAG: hypothetical protein ACTSSP_03465 [Candidatus Asgardarchaeia archaeon]|nr:hypothetical protein [Candidatus Odinarchaeota archaeon]
MENKPWRVITVDVEPRQKAFRIGISPDTKIGDVIKTLVEKCREENIDIDKWAKTKVGEQHPEFVIIRKATSEILPPALTFEELQPPIEEDEEFLIDVRAIVG